MRMKLVVFIILVFFLNSCSSYYLTKDSLKEQLRQIDSDKIYDVYDFRSGIASVLLKGDKNFYNGIEFVKCFNKKGDEVIISIKPQTAVRLTDDNGKRIVFYFDSMFLINNLIYGSKSHVISLPITPINIDKLSKIEVQ